MKRVRQGLVDFLSVKIGRLAAWACPLHGFFLCVNKKSFPSHPRALQRYKYRSNHPVIPWILRGSILGEATHTHIKYIDKFDEHIGRAHYDHPYFSLYGPHYTVSGFQIKHQEKTWRTSSTIGTGDLYIYLMATELLGEEIQEWNSIMDFYSANTR
jgi:hypothetical protein